MIILAVEKLIFRRSPDWWFFDIIFEDFRSSLGDTRFTRIFQGKRYPNFIDFGHQIVGFLETLQKCNFWSLISKVCLLYKAQILDGFKTLRYRNNAHFWREKVNWELAQVSCRPGARELDEAPAHADGRGGPHTYINCDPILSFLGACESWFQQRFLLHKGEKNSCHFGSEKVAILDDPEIWSFLVVIQCLFWNVWFAETTGVSAMRRDGK